MSKEILKVLGSYWDVYESIQGSALDRKDLVKEIADHSGIQARNTINAHVDKAFAGDLPMILLKEEKALLDIAAFRTFIEALCKDVGMDASVLFAGPAPEPKGKKEKDAAISFVGKVEAPNVVQAREENARLKAENKRLQEKIKLLEKGAQSSVCQAILSEMDKKVFMTGTLESEPKTVLREDIFLHHPGQLLDVPYLVSKYGGDVGSLYDIDRGREELTVANYWNRITNYLFTGRFLSKRVEDEMRLHKRDMTTTDKKIYENRLKSIQMLLEDGHLSNQMKLALYAGWHDYRGTEMEDLLNFAGDNCIDANYVIRMLERPKDFDNYINLRGFLRQAAKASEAKMKREAVRELIAGEWYVVAEYGGKPCRFQMLPVDELIHFRNALVKNLSSEAAATLEKMLITIREAKFDGDDPKNPIRVKDVGVVTDDESYFASAKEMIHPKELESGVDMHVAVDDDAAYDGFSESEVDSDGTE